MRFCDSYTHKLCLNLNLFPSSFSLALDLHYLLPGMLFSFFEQEEQLYNEL